MSDHLIRRIDLPPSPEPTAREILRCEWLATNGSGGYASGTISGVAARRYHGLLIASLPPPLGRVVMLNQLSEAVMLPDGAWRRLGGGPEATEARGEAQLLREFRLEAGLPCWRYEFESVLEKSLFMVHGQNTTVISYRLCSGQPLALELQPFVNFRPHHSDDPRLEGEAFSLATSGSGYEVRSRDGLPPLRLRLHASGISFSPERSGWRETTYPEEAKRGYPARGRLWSPGLFTLSLDGGIREAHLVISTEPREVVDALNPAEAAGRETERRRQLLKTAPESLRAGPALELVLAADQFLVTPPGRAAGAEARTVIAGYPWFTDWGRDTLISLEGLALATGRWPEAAAILRSFAARVRDGLIPNLFPEGAREGEYHTADATLWFFHALDRHAGITGDRGLIRELLPKLREILVHHLRGTRFGIGLDPADGLLRQGAEGYALTWMDAKVGEWVVTPRRGKAVEINALWHNALRLAEAWLDELGDAEAARPLGELAARAKESFNRRFWSEELGYLYDVVDGEHGDDQSCRPNQLLAISLRHPVLDETHWAAVLQKVRDELITPVGLRSLCRSHPDYHPRCEGGPHARDAAYHQGTVWAWLIGPYVDAWLKVQPQDRAGARKLLDGLIAQLDQAGTGSIPEIFDAEEPFTPRGCIAQAWSVAETLRCWLKTNP